LKNPPILILDEATSALDAATERKLQLALDEVMKGRTTFVIAHRLATIRNADRIVVFERGRIVETGTFDALMALDGRFAALARAQYLAPPAAPAEAEAAEAEAAE
jgi:ATP-binding cassette subfamily B protein